MSVPRIVTEPIGGSALSRAVQSGALDASIAAPAPRTVDQWKARAASVAAQAPEGWFGALRDACGGAGHVLDRLERIAGQGGVVVTTGQQAGLFGGPVYTWTKAIGALELADAIERATGVPAAPVFWAATDDADFAEASATYVAVEGAVRRLVSEHAPPAGTPMALAPIGDLSGPLRDLRAACGSLAFARAWAAVEQAYRAPATVGSAYVALLRAMLEPLGIAVLDSSHPTVRAAGEGVMRRALERASAVGAALDARHAALVGLGFDPQVSDVSGLSTVFVHEAGVKRRVPVAEAAGVRATAAAVALSPNVLLRPVMERAILPTVAYVAGPGELAYFAQVSAVAGALDAAQPVAVPRWSCTIVEPPVDRALSRLGIGLDELTQGAALEGRVARAGLPDEVRAGLDDLRAAVRDGLAALSARDARTPGGALLPGAVVEGAARQVGFRLDRLERRLVAAAKRRGSGALRDLRLAQAAILPGGHRQERTLNFLPFLARHGDALIAAMRASAAAHAQRLVSGASSGG
ncbi:MAG TPA: bacillithiol biosynthesis BshC [Gemmatimonadaceae bacterium]|nr:bacillithiol biosynthesis BshC [Gemmatimonadaceae bacterium]